MWQTRQGHEGARPYGLCFTGSSSCYNKGKYIYLFVLEMKIKLQIEQE